METKKLSAKRLEINERKNSIKNRIRNVGIERIPTQRELGKIYGVSAAQIHKDIHSIISELDPNELDTTFTDFYSADMEALYILREIMINGDNTEKVASIRALITLQEGATKLLESFSKKQKVAEKVQVESVNYSFKMEKPIEPTFIIGEPKKEKNGKD